MILEYDRSDLEVASRVREQHNNFVHQLAKVLLEWRRNPEYKDMCEIAMGFGDQFPAIFKLGYQTFSFVASDPSRPFRQFDKVQPVILTDVEFSRLWLQQSYFQQTPEQAFEEIQNAVTDAVKRSVHQFMMTYNNSYRTEQIIIANKRKREFDIAAQKIFWKKARYQLGWISLLVFLIICLFYVFRNGITSPFG